MLEKESSAWGSDTCLLKILKWDFSPFSPCTSIFSTLNRDKNCTYLKVLLWGLNELMHIRHSEWCLAQSKTYTSSCYYYCCCYWCYYLYSLSSASSSPLWAYHSSSISPLQSLPTTYQPPKDLLTLQSGPVLPLLPTFRGSLVPSPSMPSSSDWHLRLIMTMPLPNLLWLHFWWLWAMFFSCMDGSV